MKVKVLLIVFLSLIGISCTHEIIKYEVIYNSFTPFKENVDYRFKYSKNIYIVDTLKRPKYKLYLVSKLGHEDDNCNINLNYKFIINFNLKLKIDTLSWNNIDKILKNEDVFIFETYFKMYEYFSLYNNSFYKDEYRIFD